MGRVIILQVAEAQLKLVSGVELIRSFGQKVIALSPHQGFVQCCQDLIPRLCFIL